MIKYSVFVFLTLSIVIHISFWGGINFFSNNTNLTQKEKVTIELIESESSKKSKSMNEKKLQIVDQDKKPLNNEVDENAELL
ncbi:MAG: hypothetical protein KDD50_15550, partial [Bdellovibrionales bacterium]|nr:hypothetical protein [Bdellovibrionales bacterium]